jgi:hypothetical protein
MGGAAEEGGSERSYWGGTLLNMIPELRNVPRGADLRVHRKSSDFAKEPPPRMRSDRRARSPPFRSMQITGGTPLGPAPPSGFLDA